MENKKGWSNHEWDSSIFMASILIIFGGYLWLCATNAEFRGSEIGHDLLLIFSAILSAMGNYFFNKSRQAKQNGNGEQK